MAMRDIINSVVQTIRLLILIQVLIVYFMEN